MTRRQTSLVRSGRIAAYLLVTCSITMQPAWGPASGTAHAADEAAIDAAIRRGTEWLGNAISKERDMGYRALAAIALLKGGAPPDHPGIMSVVEPIRKSVQSGKYPGSSERASKGMYLVGIEAMLLADLDPVKYRAELQAIADYIIEQQRKSGGWNYTTDGENSPIDTSVTQYACLGLWAAQRAGIEIPQSVWARALGWFNTHQQPDGGFAYRPGDTRSREGATLSMTAAAVGTMHLILMHLDPAAASRSRTAGRPPRKDLKFGVLETIPDEPPVVPSAPTAARADNSIDVAALAQVARRVLSRAEAWLATRFVPMKPDRNHRTYYIYTIERVGAFANTDTIGAHNWFEECANIVLKRQKPDGSWDFDSGERPSAQAAFAILFLTRSTAKSMGRSIQRTRLGQGLLAGGRGLPDDLRTVEIQNGVVVAREIKGPLDELLTELSTGKGMELAAVQEEVIEKIQFGSREELIGQKQTLLKLVEHKDPEIRRTALWALGRTDDLTLVPLLITALDDPELAVAIEARNALCWISRRPNGFGLPENPLADLPPNTPEQQQLTEIAEWREKAVRRWGRWYLQIRPFAERGDAFEAELRARIGE